FLASTQAWRQLDSDPGAGYDTEFHLDASSLPPMITFGTNPGMAMGIEDCIPAPNDDGTLLQALDYMGLEPGTPLLGHPIDVVFIGSCTNGRLSDLRQAASILQGRKIHPSVHALIVPGSKQVQRQAEAEGLQEVFLSSGAQWREPGCSMCIAMNGDQVPAGQ